MTSKTELVYFDDTYLNSVDAKVVSVAPQGEDGTFAVVLDRTVAYPAGGGQPSDGGRIVAADGGATFLVSEVKSADGSVLHLGAFEDAGAGAESSPSASTSSSPSTPSADSSTRAFTPRATSSTSR